MNMFGERAEEIRTRFLSVDTSNAADVLDELGLHHQGLAPTFSPFPASAGKLAGWAYTIRGEMAAYPLGAGDPAKMDACARLTPGTVSVWSGAGKGICFFGELISIGMKERGCVGALVDGGVRDIDWIDELAFPVYARYRTPVQSIGRWKVTDSGQTVPMPGATVPEVQVTPGDFILGDSDGVIVIPSAVVEEVLQRAEALGAREVRIRAELANGLSLSEALAKFGHV